VRDLSGIFILGKFSKTYKLYLYSDTCVSGSPLILRGVPAGGGVGEYPQGEGLKYQFPNCHDV